MGKLQEERSAETRGRLVDAAVDCLFERGFVGLTTAEVAERAGVSKGAQLHHFPSKTLLVVAALDHLFDLRVAASREILAEKLPSDRKKRLSAIIDFLVPVYRDKVFYAWLELVVASRTDLALREAVCAASERFSNQIQEIWKELFGAQLDDRAEYRLIDRFINGQLAAMALGRILLGGEDDPAEFAEIVEHLKNVGPLALPQQKKKVRKL